MFLFIPCYFIKLISLLEAGQTPLLKYMIRNFLIYVNKNQRSLNEEEKQSKNIRHNFSSYSLTKDEVEALSYGIDQHIPKYNDRNNINTEFELLFQNILNDIFNTAQETLTNIKTNLRSYCEEYYNKKHLQSIKKSSQICQRTAALLF